MNKAIIGKKLGMTQIFTPDGLVVPVTVVEAGPCTVVQKKTVAKEGYNSLVVAFDETKESRVNKAQMGAFKKANVSAHRILRELKLDDVSAYEIGKPILCDIFNEKDKVDVVGLTRGRGFTGVIQRWNHHRLKMTHGTGPVHREVGSMGANSSPSRVFKNKHMPGRYGHEQVTIQNLEIVKVDAGRNALLIKGAIPGPKGGIVCISNSVKG